MSHPCESLRLRVNSKGLWLFELVEEEWVGVSAADDFEDVDGAPGGALRQESVSTKGSLL
jgi:hypothetical protein